MAEVAEELTAQGADAEVREGVVDAVDMPYLELTVAMGAEEDFTYRVWRCESRIPSFAPHVIRAQETYFRIEVYLTEGSQGYDVLGCSQDQLISDILDQYERHIEFLRLPRNTPRRPTRPRTRHRRSGKDEVAEPDVGATTAHSSPRQ